MIKYDRKRRHICNRKIEQIKLAYVEISNEAFMGEQWEYVEQTALGSEVPEEEQVVALLISLARSYKTLVTDLEAKGDDLSLPFLQQALVNKEQNDI